MTKHGKDDVVTHKVSGIDYRINHIANFDDFYAGVAIDKNDHPYYHCVPIDGGEAMYIPEKLLECFKGDNNR